MKLELYYAKNCPSCAKVRDFISVKNLGSQISLREANDQGASANAGVQAPRLMVDGRAIQGAEQIIQWIDRNLSPSDSHALTL